MKHTKTKNIRFEDGEWWYVGQADGRRRVNSHEKKNNTYLSLILCTKQEDIKHLKARLSHL